LRDIAVPRTNIAREHSCCSAKVKRAIDRDYDGGALANASYVELSLRTKAPLATRDAALAKATTAAGATLFTA
jgi:predicted nucleic acid-binding protein